MNRLYLSDLHIGFTNYPRLLELENFVVRNKIQVTVLHGDTFHLNEIPWEEIVRTADCRIIKAISCVAPTELILGNHDFDYPKYASDLPNIKIIEPYEDEYGRWHSHWCEFDPVFQLSPKWFLRFWANMFRGHKTPGILKQGLNNRAWIASCQVIHTNILLDRIRNEEGEDIGPRYKEYIGGHTHFYMDWDVREAGIQLWNCGNFCQKPYTGILETDGKLEIIEF